MRARGGTLSMGPHNGIGMSDCYNSLAGDYADIAEVARNVMLLC